MVSKAGGIPGIQTTHHAVCQPSRANPKENALEHFPKVIKRVKFRFTDILSIQSYRPVNNNQRSDYYAAKLVAKTAEHIQVEMGPNTLDLTDSISPLIFLWTFRTIRDNNSVWKSCHAALQLLYL